LFAGAVSTPVQAQVLPKSLEQGGSGTTPTVLPRTWTIYSTCAKWMWRSRKLMFDDFRNQRKISNLEPRVNYIVRLPVSRIRPAKAACQGEMAKAMSL
jgi:hypothetical protein